MERTAWDDLCNSYRQTIKGLRVGFYGSGGSPYHHAALAALWGADLSPVYGHEIRSGRLQDLDVLVVPGGGAHAMAGLLAPLGGDGADAVRKFVESGGMYIGSCAGSFLPARVGNSFWEENPIAKRMCMVDACLFNSADSEWSGLTSPGVGTIVAAPARPRHWLARGLPPRFHLVHYNGPMFDVSGSNDGGELGRAEGVVRFVEATEDFTPGESFMDRNDPAELGDSGAPSTLFDQGAAAGAYTAIAAAVGKGTVVLYGSHPEFGLDEIQLGWSDGVRLFGNALAKQADRRNESPKLRGAKVKEAKVLFVEDDVKVAVQKFSDLSDTFATLAATPFCEVERGSSLPKFLGRTQEEIWRTGSQAASRAARSSSLQLQAWLEAGTFSGKQHLELDIWLRQAAKEVQDYGFVGLLPLLAETEKMLLQSKSALKMGADLAPLLHAYDGLDWHPYQLTASSYLSAAGLTASATLVVATLGALVDATENEKFVEVLLA